VPFDQRGLPLDAISRPLYSYQVEKTFEVFAGTAANYGAGGGGMQYDLGKGRSVQSLIDDGSLKQL